MGPIGLPFQRTSTAPAFPTLSIATSSPVSVLVWLGCRIPEKIGLPSLVMESQVLSVAERFSSTRFTPSVPAIVVFDDRVKPAQCRRLGRHGFLPHRIAGILTRQGRRLLRGDERFHTRLKPLLVHTEN